MKKYCMLIAVSLIFAFSIIPSFAQDEGRKPAASPSAKPSSAKKDGAPEPTPTRPQKTTKPEGAEIAAAPTPKLLPTPKLDSPEYFRTQLNQLQERFNQQQDQLGKQHDQLNVLQNSLRVSPDGSPTALELGPLGWFTSPLLFWTAALLFILSLALHAIHMLKETHTNRVIGQLWNVQQRSASASRPAVPGRNGAVESLTEQVREQGKGLNQFTTQINQLQDRLVKRDKQFADAVQAVALTANWVGHAQLREAATNDGGQINEGDRASAIALLERYEEPLRVNAGRIEPLAQAVAALMGKTETQPQLPPELVSRVQSLHQDIGQFDLWQTNVSGQLASLRRGSFSARNTMLQADQQRLIQQVNAGDISITQMVQKSRELIDHHFPGNTQKSLAKLPSADDEIELKKRVASAPELLMDWFDSFSQFQSQMIGGQASRIPLDPDIMSRLVQIQMLAREVLSKFDIQPEEIQVGRTGYDRRLHEATLVRQSPQFPVNTVIEVLRCGFRRMSTGEVLRRPQVVVAGAVTG